MFFTGVQGAMHLGWTWAFNYLKFVFVFVFLVCFVFYIYTPYITIWRIQEPALGEHYTPRILLFGEYKSRLLANIINQEP